MGDDGWVSLWANQRQLLVKLKCWEVERGGIVVRGEKEVTSSEVGVRLATGSVVRELERVEERLHYSMVTGSGPETGWVSLHFREKPLLVCCEKSLPDGIGRAGVPSRPASLGRRMRVLALHGSPGNSNIMRFQVSRLQRALGSDFEWFFADGACAWEAIPGATQLPFAERSEVEKKLAKGLPFVQWYEHRNHDTRPSPGGESVEPQGVMYELVESCLSHLDEIMAREGPFDVVVGYSQGGTALAMWLDSLRKVGKDAAWQMNVLFCGSMIDDERRIFQERSSKPTLYVHGGAGDPWGRHGERCLPRMYSDLEMFEHQDGHVFPTSQPRADEIYAEVVKRVRCVCGLPLESPQAALRKYKS